jgi:phage terminase large subunit-like protein
MNTKTATPRIHPATIDGTPDGDPVLLTRERIIEKRRDQGPYIFGCQLLLNPQADETQGFKAEWLRQHDDINRKGLNVYLLFDPANEKKASNDYTCGWVVGLGTDEKIRVLNMVRDRLNLTQRTALVMNWHRTYKPIRQDGTRYEHYGMQADIEHIRGQMVSENYDFEITPVGGQTPKNDRIRRLIPYFEQGRIILPRSLYYTDYTGKTRDLVHDFIEEEYKPFPVPVHDDMLDSLARLLEPSLPLIWPKLKTPQLSSGYGGGDTSGQGWLAG